jgi:hypothetical protein
MTVLDLIKLSLLDLGVLGEGETPSDAMANHAMTVINLLLGEWNNDPHISYTEQQSFSVVSGTASYVVGSGQTWDGNKPLTIEKAYIQDSDGYDHPLSIIGEKEYMDIHDKDLSARPTKLYYKPSNSTGTVYLYGEPEASYTIYILGPLAFTEYDDPTTTISLPNGYLQALRYNLDIELSPSYHVDINRLILSKAASTLDDIKSTNRPKPRTIKTDNQFTGNGHYDINTSTFI